MNSFADLTVLTLYSGSFDEPEIIDTILPLTYGDGELSLILREELGGRHAGICSEGSVGIWIGDHLFDVLDEIEQPHPVRPLVQHLHAYEPAVIGIHYVGMEDVRLPSDLGLLLTVVVGDRDGEPVRVY